MLHRCGFLGVFSLCLIACEGDSEGAGDDASGGATGGSATGGSATGGSAQCGGGNGSFTPAAIEAADEYCTARAAHVAACGTPNDDPTCPEISCIERVYESAAFVAYVDCQTQKDCASFLATDDDCFESASGPISSELLEWVDFCQAKLEE